MKKSGLLPCGVHPSLHIQRHIQRNHDFRSHARQTKVILHSMNRTDRKSCYEAEISRLFWLPAGQSVRGWTRGETGMACIHHCDPDLLIQQTNRHPSRQALQPESLRNDKKDLLCCIGRHFVVRVRGNHASGFVILSSARVIICGRSGWCSSPETIASNPPVFREYLEYPSSILCLSSVCSKPLQCRVRQTKNAKEKMMKILTYSSIGESGLHPYRRAQVYVGNISHLETNNKKMASRKARE